jgi:metacaspase-1
VTLLKQEMLFSVIDAAVEAGLECDSLLLSIPREVQASLARLSGRSSREQFLTVLSQLNDWGAHEHKEPPLRRLMQSMHFLAQPGAQAQVFQRALTEIDRAPSRVNDPAELLFLRTKDYYVERGYRVVPPVNAPVSLTFQAWRAASAVSIIGVAAVASLDAVIRAVRELVEQLEGRERVEGCVVLFSGDPREVERVREASLTPVPYGELALMGVREITAFVDRQQAELVQRKTDVGETIEDKDLCRELRAALREGPVRIVTVAAPSTAESARRIVLSLTSDYLRDPARAAPLLLPLPMRPSGIQDLVAAAFNERRVPFSRFDFPGLLAEKAFLPVFLGDSRDPLISDLRPVLDPGGKVVLVTSKEGAIAPQEVHRRWGVPARHVRALTARTPPTKGSVGRPTPRFEQGRALLVGVANYTSAPKLPEMVLNDARDLAAVLQSPDRCGYLEENVELLLDEQATAELFRRGLRNLVASARRDDTVVVYFSGHGFRVEREGTESQPEAYLLPFDYDPRDLARTALSASELSGLLAAIQSSRLVVLLDACHAAGAAYMKSAVATASLKSGLGDKTYEALGRGVGRVVIASSRANEPSCGFPGMKNSLFTTYLLEALVGAATSPHQKVVRVLEVFHHIAENVPRKASQHPILKTQDLENNFPIALNSP